MNCSSVHGEVNAGELAARHRQIAGFLCPAGEQHGSVVVTQPTCSNVHTDVDASPEDDAFGLHHRETAIEMPLLHLELRDAVTQEPADPIGLLEDGH
jgi:hypothetical protein